MEPAYRRCCGIDVHKKSISVCLLPPVGSRSILIKEEKFRTFTRDLKRLRTWLINCRVPEIVMESTGQYWRPVLAAGLEHSRRSVSNHGVSESAIREGVSGTQNGSP